MKNGHENQEINWRTISIYIDVETGELIGEKLAKSEYTIINKKTKRNVYKRTGTTQITNECRRNKFKQLEIFNTTYTA